MNSFLRWAGSKNKLVPKLRPYWPGGPARYIEPFVGSGCLFFDLEPQRAILGDINWELICTMRALQSDVNSVLRCIRELPTGKAAYYRVRATDTETLAEPEIAARFIYLNHYCFNGLYRTNLRGRFNVPYGSPKGRAPIDEAPLINASRALQNVMLIHGDFEETIAHARPGDFVYLDPPYVVGTRRMFAEYLPGSFNANDLPRLESALRNLDAMGITFLVTYADSPEARKLLAPWKSHRVRTRRNISGFAAGRRRAYELIATNSPAERTPNAS